MQINIKSRVIGFWLSTINGKKSKLSKLFYKVMPREQEKGVYDFKWIHCSNDILVSVGRPDVLKTDTVSNPKAVKMGI